MAHKYCDSKLRVINLEPTNFAPFPKSNEATYNSNHRCGYGCENHDDEFKNISFSHERKGSKGKFGKERDEQNNKHIEDVCYLCNDKSHYFRTYSTPNFLIDFVKNCKRFYLCRK